MAALEHTAVDPFNERELITWGHEDICKDYERLNLKKCIEITADVSRPDQGNA